MPKKIAVLPPLPPESLRVSAIKARSIVVAWNKPSSVSVDPMASIISQYQLQYKRETDKHPIKKLLHGDVTTYEITDLLPKELVSGISVAACNFVGWGQATIWHVEARTVADIPTEPHNLHVIHNTKTTITMGWETPLQTNGDDIKQYEIELSQSGREDRFFLTQGPVLEYKMAGLSHSSEHSVRARAANVAGWGPWTELVIVATNVGPPLAPTMMPMRDATTDSIVVSWLEPKGSKDVEEYELEVTQDTMEPEVWRSPHEPTQVTLVNLRSLWPISVRVRAKNYVGFGNWSEPVQGVTAAAVWSWGSNSHGQLGRDEKADADKDDDWQKGGAGGWNASKEAEYRKKHGLYAISQPKPALALRDKNAFMVAAGKTHSLCVTTSGAVYAWGNNRFGQLGISTRKMPQSMYPVRLATRSEVFRDGCKEAEQGLPEVCTGVWCTRDSSFVIGEGDIYTFGSGNSGVLGHGDERNREEPMVVDNLKEKNCVLVATGDNHVLVVANNQLFAFGYGLQGQLGTGRCENEVFPHHIPLPGLPVSLGAGSSHSAAVLEDGRLFMWGQGRDGRLGIENPRGQLRPIQVKWFEENGLEVSKIACGWYHNLALTKCGRTFAWGNGSTGILGTGPRPLPDRVVRMLGDITGNFKQIVPIEVPGLIGFKATWIECGPTSSFAGSEMEAFGWGEAANIIQADDGDKRVFFPKPLFRGLCPRLRHFVCSESHVLLCGGSALATEEEEEIEQ